MNEKNKISKQEYLESLYDALESVKAVLNNNLIKKLRAICLK